MILQVVATSHVVQAFESRVESTQTILIFGNAKLPNQRSCNQSPTRALAAMTLPSETQREREQMEYHIHSRSPTRKTSRGRPLDVVVNSFAWRLIIRVEPNEAHGATYKVPEATLNKASAALDAKAKTLVSGTLIKDRVFDAIGILKIHPGCPFATEKAILRVLGANHFLLANARGSATRDLCDRLAGTKSLLGRLVGLNGAIRYRFRGGPSVSK